MTNRVWQWHVHIVRLIEYCDRRLHQHQIHEYLFRCRCVALPCSGDHATYDNVVYITLFMTSFTFFGRDRVSFITHTSYPEFTLWSALYLCAPHAHRNTFFYRILEVKWQLNTYTESFIFPAITREEKNFHIPLYRRAPRYPCTHFQPHIYEYDKVRVCVWVCGCKFSLFPSFEFFVHTLSSGCACINTFRQYFTTSRRWEKERRQRSEMRWRRNDNKVWNAKNGIRCSPCISHYTKSEYIMSIYYAHKVISYS